MTLVGMLRSLIAQGMYFHPFGGAVDIIVVEQEDGTYRSTPWYVRFGKFQGILIGDEKVVTISVNGVEANFHMYIDKAGEAYFMREVMPGDDANDNEPSAVVNVDGKRSSFDERKVVNEDNDYECQDDRSLWENGSETVDSGSYQYGNLDDVESIIDSSKDNNSEMVLVSVDGHVLTVPISSNGESTGDVQLDIPEFHLGPVEGSGDELNSKGNAWKEVFYSDMDLSLPKNSENSDSQSESFRDTKEVFFCKKHGRIIRDSGTESENTTNKGLEKKNNEVEDTPGRSIIEDECNKTSGLEKGIPGLGIEISLCGNLLHPGMGRKSAEEVFEAHRISIEDFEASGATIVKNGDLIIRWKERYIPWDKGAHIVLGLAVFGCESTLNPEHSITIENKDTSKGREDASVGSSTSSLRWRLWPIPFRRVKSTRHTDCSAANGDSFIDKESDLQEQHIEQSPSGSNCQSACKQFLRTNIPTTEQIASLNLKDGQNMVTFSSSTRFLGKQQVDAHIYLWKWNAQIVISDVDGTITKSDVLGQVMPLVGKDWTQSGVARLFSAIRDNGYQLLFLSARAIVQAYLTRSFLLNLKQDGKALPKGPVVISPDGLFPALYREVIRRAPHEFKIACLEDIRALFPSDYNPFYAGFGNRDTDELSYRKIGIPKGKIFIINPMGEVAINNCIDVKSYTSLHTLVNDIFPPTSLVEQEDFNSWNYWKMPLPSVDREFSSFR